MASVNRCRHGESLLRTRPAHSQRKAAGREQKMHPIDIR